MGKPLHGVLQEVFSLSITNVTSQFPYMDVTSSSNILWNNPSNPTMILRDVPGIDDDCPKACSQINAACSISSTDNHV